MPAPIGPSDDASDPPAWKYRQHQQRNNNNHSYPHRTAAPKHNVVSVTASTVSPAAPQQSYRRSRRNPALLLTTTMCLAAAATVIALSMAPASVLAGPPRYSSRIVETRTGAIRGVILELDSRHLEPVEAFKAVPYAAPPVGALRFEAPQPLAQPWKGTRLADTFGDVCPQVRLEKKMCIYFSMVLLQKCMMNRILLPMIHMSL